MATTPFESAENESLERWIDDPEALKKRLILTLALEQPAGIKNLTPHSTPRFWDVRSRVKR